MLTSSANQYLRPEYLTPLPTTLDAKKSPLALLAQTCSQIGADTSSTKPLIPPLEKKKNSSSSSESSSSRDKNSPGSSSSSGGVSDRSKSQEKKEGESGPGSCNSSSEERKTRTPISKSSSPTSVGGSPSPNSSSKTPLVSSESKATSDLHAPASSSSSSTTTSTAVTSTSSSKLGGFSSVLTSSESSSVLKDLPLGTFKPGLPGPLGYPSCHLPMDSGLMSPLKQGLGPSLAGLNPYLSYARLKTPSGGEALVPVCRDPYCTGCQLNVPGGAAAVAAAHMLKSSGAASGGCPSGCVQCDHQKTGFASLASLMPGIPPSALAYSPPHSFLGGPLPYVCNWIQGDAYCGKRFSSSEELLQHLRSHTNLSAAAAAAAAAAAQDSAAAAAAASSSLALLNPGGLPPHPLLHRTYPTPPLSPLSAAARYHPYGKPTLAAGLAGLPASSLAAGSIPGLAPHPAMAQYYSPYSFYGQRLGATGLHP